MAITLLQLAQMVAGIVVTTAALLYGGAGYTCHVNRTNSVLGLAMYASYFLLFLQFFLQNNFGKASEKAVKSTGKGKRE
jgi:elongation of very long chain fatty acids protein 6